MKKYLCVVLLSTIFSCNKANNNMTETEFFDLSRSHKPTENDIQKITESITVKDVINILGKPHCYGPKEWKYITLVWETSEGNIYFATVEFDLYNSSANILNRIYETGLLTEKPVKVDPAYLYGTSLYTANEK